ncbi:M1 family metallopeptidase [Maribacter sp. PR1]|uniref:Aminopeptidase N n=1 Tax=Maribacter cobaltidurans TaxID=1178778 RepID=A0ABU7IVI8_9FLAO|nr:MULTISPECIES: M1 family metallopeptidase [Maribacter]MDC6389616.1 M1 family metallopeptidase [Maribacter sp. PR1]MEE1977005.1 M1 family metallopeptidase [Maribacter cobaltidurans]
MTRFLYLFFLSIIYGNAQHQENVDFIHANVFISPNLAEKSLAGNVEYTFEILQDIDSVWLDAKNMDFEKIQLDDKRIKWGYDDEKILIKEKFNKGSVHKLYVQYKCTPKQTVYFIGIEDDNRNNDQVWTQGQGKYSSHWLPSFDDMEEKVEFDLSINTSSNNQVIANGKLQEISGGVWKFDMNMPMSSYLLAFAIGNYRKQEVKSDSGVTIENYFYPKDSLKVEPTYRYTKEVFDFFEEEIGVDYPWQNYKQIPVHDFLYAGMENTGTTIFSDAYVIDSTSFIDRNYVNINAHELAHQWFGNLVTEKDGKNHWLHEGFATYYAYLAERELFGEEHFYWKLYDTAKQLLEISDGGKGESLLNPKASSLTFYEKGAWALVILREQVGEEAFKKGIKSYLQKFAYQNVTVDDFLMEMEEASKQNLDSFKSSWLISKEFPRQEVYTYLKNKNERIVDFLSFQKRTDSTSVLDEEKLMWLLDRNSSIPFKNHMLYRYGNQISDSTVHNIFVNDTSLLVRQALALAIPKVSEHLKKNFESLLTDKSYVTQEQTLFKLWETFPEKKFNYLDTMSEVTGLPNKNVRLLWLTLALVTPNYNEVEKVRYLDELISYTNSSYNPEVRQNAFQYLYQINGVNQEVLRQLILASNHHSWQFRKYARNLLDTMLESKKLKEQITTVAMQLKPSDLRYLKTKLDL